MVLLKRQQLINVEQTSAVKKMVSGVLIGFSNV